MDKSIVCRITGKKYAFSGTYFDKKVEEYGDINELKQFFVTKKVKSYIERGYNPKEIRNLLGIDESNLLPADAREIIDIVNYHKLKNTPSAIKTSMNFATHKSDRDVLVFINNIKQQSI